MKSEYSPGPWKIKKDPEGIQIWNADHFICRVNDSLYFSDERRGATAANAALIAAAPEMFEALLLMQDIETLAVKTKAFDFIALAVGKAMRTL